MNQEALSNGNLKISLEDQADEEFVTETLERHGGDDILFLCELLEHTGWTPNGVLHRVAPEAIGALTEAPILTDECLIDDKGDVTVQGKVWWYPDYMVRHFGQVLLEKKEVVFTAAPK
ncbi:hypothetical protein LC612_30845 [Nostoc sp. CHAB 5834]|nr:hypothetical protein [Nostoc sp. CHAB 5834]